MVEGIGKVRLVEEQRKGGPGEGTKSMQARRQGSEACLCWAMEAMGATGATRAKRAPRRLGDVIDVMGWRREHGGSKP